MAYLRGRRNAATTPAEWWDSTFERRMLVDATNTSGTARDDVLVRCAVPAGATITSATVRVVEHTANGPIDRAYDWRYLPGSTSDRNHLPLLPATVAAGVVTFKALGTWAAGERRVFGVYWTEASAPSAPDFHHLAAPGVSSPYYLVGRSGPDTATLTHYDLGLPSSAHSSVGNLLALGRPGVTQLLRFLRYRVNGDATDYGAISATQDTVMVDGPTITVSGTITCSTRAAGVDWSGTYTAVYQHRFVLGDKSDGNAADSLSKHVDLCHLSVVYTCQRAYTPINDPGGNGNTQLELCQLFDASNTYVGNATILPGYAIPNWYQAPGGSLTSIAASADLSGVPVVADLLIGAGGNAHAVGVRLASISFANFGGQTPGLRLLANSTPNVAVLVNGLHNTSTIPVGATITLEVWHAQHTTPNALTVGDVLLPAELADVLTEADWSPLATPLTNETHTSASATLLQTLTRAGARVVRGVQWFQTNAASLTGTSRGYAFGYNVKTGAVVATDDDDGNYGEAHKLHGLCLRYLRTHDSALVALIENQVQWHLDLEAAAVSQYGSWWAGATPYWYWPSPTNSGTTYNTEGGCQEATNTGTTPNALIDPAWAAINGGIYGLGSITYTQGQVRRKHSIDQCHITAHGLFAYLYLLRGEAAITANTTLRTNALAYLGRMATFEANKYNPSDRIIGNAYAICNAGSFGAATNSNGISTTLINTGAGTALANPYYGQYYGTWEVSNTNGADANSSSNYAMDNWFRAVWAADSVEAGVRRFMQGQMMDMLLLDLSRHDIEKGSSIATEGVLGAYPAGWSTRAGVAANTGGYAASRDLTAVPSNNGFSSDLHWLKLNSAGALDQLTPRAAQRAVMLAFMALLDPSYAIPTEMNGATVLRSVNVLTALDDQMRAIALYGPEPTTNAQRFMVPGSFGKSTNFDPQVVDSAFTGYWLMAIEMWHLVQLRVAGTNLLPTYYRFAGT